MAERLKSLMPFWRVLFWKWTEQSDWNSNLKFEIWWHREKDENKSERERDGGENVQFLVDLDQKQSVQWCLELFNAKTILVEKQHLSYLTKSWGGKVVHTFPMGIILKAMVIGQLEFILVYNDVTVQRVWYYAKGDSSLLFSQLNRVTFMPHLYGVWIQIFIFFEWLPFQKIKSPVHQTICSQLWRKKR